MNVVLSSVPLYFVPVVVAIAVASFSRSAAQSSRGRALSIIGVAGALVVLLIDARPLLAGQQVFSHALRLARIGSADANLSFWLDPKSFALSVAVLLATLLWLLSSPSKKASAASQTGIGIAAASLLVATLGDGFPSLLLGWTGFGIASAAVLGATSSRAAARALGAVVGASVFIALGAGLIFWGVSGRFLDGRRYLSDYRAPFAASSKLVDAAALPNHSGIRASSIGEKSMLTILTHPGARIYLGLANESQLTPKNPPFGVSPMVRAELPAGLQKVAIDSGGGAIVGGDGREVALIAEVRFPPNEEVEIRAVGPTLSFHEIDAQLQSDATAFAGRQLGALNLLDAACAALGLGILGLAFASGRIRKDLRAPRQIAFASAGTSILAAVVALRLGAVFAAAPIFGGAIAALALVVALHAALRATRAWSASAFLADAGRTAVAFVVATATLSISAAAIVIAIGSALGLIAMGVLFERDLDEPTAGRERAIETGSPAGRWARDGKALALATVALLGAPIPFAGSFIGIGALGMAAFSRGGLLGDLIAVLGATTWAALTFAAYRAYFCITHATATKLQTAAEGSDESADATTKKKLKKSKKQEKKTSTAPLVASEFEKTVAKDPWPMIFAVVGCVGAPLSGIALGALEEPAGQALVARVLIILALAAPALITGHFARKRYGEGRRPNWIEQDRSGALASFNEKDETPDNDQSSNENKPDTSKLGTIFLGIDLFLDAPIDLLARALARRGSSGKEPS